MYPATIRKTGLAICLAAFAIACSWGQAATPKMDVGQSSTASNQKISILDQVGIDQHLNQRIPLEAQFTDENGQTVSLKQYFGVRPVLVTMVYYQCPMLCSQELNGLTSSLNVLSQFNVGREFDVITVSFDPTETPELAAESKKKFLERYRRPGAAQGWHFLTGKKDQIELLSQSLGFRYAWDPEIKQYAHASGIMLITPDGRIAQYYYGIEYAPRDLRLGFIEAAQGKIGTVVDQVLLYCYHYDPARGKYGAAVFNILRIGALATVLVICGFMFIMIRREHRPAHSAA
ncbi:MAG TPA: SCO family protein [Candidatus Angelobacter sp.]|nr:SCO family protein [Candidatus Angelobacter sp.]